MSVIQDAVKKLDSSSEAAAKEVKASLDMLTSLAGAKKVEMDVRLNERTSTAKDRHEIPPGTVLYDASSEHVVSSKGPSEGIKNAIGLLLKNAEENWKTATADLIGTALNVLLGAAAGATSTETYYIIALDGHAADPSKQLDETYVPIRIDYALWVYNFHRQGLTDTVDSALVYRARRATLDYANMPSPVQIDQTLKDIGMPKAQRDALEAQINKEADKRAKNLRAYANELADPEERATLLALVKESRSATAATNR